jgi:murein DD-endopeptidase MepM/ murein hydrolase activator NlpD
VVVAVEALDSRGVLRVEVEVDGVPVPSAPGEVFAEHRATVATSGLSDGVHSVVVRAVDRSLRRNEALLRFELVTDNTAPRPQVARSSLVGRQGRTLAVLVRFDEPVVGPRAELLGRGVELEALDDGLWRGLFGIGVSQAPGDWTLRITAADAAGNALDHRADVAVEATDFPDGGFIQLTQTQTAARQDRSAADESNGKRRRAYGADVGASRWSGLFDRPAEGPLTSPFGKVRTYSDGKTRHHLGTDIAAPSGTPVYAPAGGVVTLAEELHIYGNAVIVTHGPGVATSYNHLSSIEVDVGDEVARGDLVGRIGSTGQSTGPHLHWGMVVGGEAVQPDEWMERAFDAPLPEDFEETVQ